MDRGFLKASLALALSGGIAAIAPLGAPVAMAQSTRDAGAEAYVQAGAHDVLVVLNDKSRSIEGKRDAFRGIVNRLVDVPRVTRFVLGKYARTATPDQYQRFATVFRTYAEGVYQKRIDDYHGEKVVVVTSLVRKPGDVLVTTQLSGGKMQQPTTVVWRVLGSAGQWRVVDVQVSGVWLAITQQQDFVSTIDNAGGKIDVLINQLAHDTNGEVLHVRK
jgi:phospholipid transport system substrate-binding protein